MGNWVAVSLFKVDNHVTLRLPPWSCGSPIFEGWEGLKVQVTPIIKDDVKCSTPITKDDVKCSRSFCHHVCYLWYVQGRWLNKFLQLEFTSEQSCHAGAYLWSDMIPAGMAMQS